MATEKAVVTQQYLTDIADAIRAKGVTTDALLPSQMAGAIEAIPSGGVDPDYLPEHGMIDIVKILNENKGDYEHACIVLYLAYAGNITISGANKIVTSDGQTFTGTSSRSIAFDNSKALVDDNGVKCHWALMLYDEGGEKSQPTIGNIALWLYATDGVMFKATNTVNLKNVKALDATFVRSTATSSIRFSHCNSLIRPPKIDGYENTTNINYMFLSNLSLRAAPSRFVYPLSTGLYSNTGVFPFRNCYSLRYLPEEVDLSSQTYIANALSYRDDGGTSMIQNLPHIFKANVSVNLSEVKMASKDHLAQFDEDGNIIGGLAFGLSVCGNSEQTFTLSTNLKNQLTAAELTKVEQMFEAKNWSLVWA